MNILQNFGNLTYPIFIYKNSNPLQTNISENKQSFYQYLFNTENNTIFFSEKEAPVQFKK